MSWMERTEGRNLGHVLYLASWLRTACGVALHGGKMPYELSSAAWESREGVWTWGC